MYRIRDGIVLLKIQDEYYLSAAASARNYCPLIRQINHTGALIFDEIFKGKEINHIVKLLCKKYEADDHQQIRNDIDAFLDQLILQHYLIAEIQENR